MSKGHADHRVVIRDENGRIIKDTPAENFSLALPIYEAELESLAPAHSVALQHGARIIRQS
ncbi:hypothetical protein P775_28505 [Puniceibacterium antarcticum]|uniref:Uncharacterized protein n=1 Tax=Puniceibacterium antarcticum TaxID=1206336 RepID=A0A2G8QT30_9RHOB|nr:hypothetical protein [Puniceibacterium antarcticum]PIL12446.1 hypothetical protein P775_28505 [Puniceibacterium antarcticum]